jgi:hypothetical protein
MKISNRGQKQSDRMNDFYTRRCIRGLAEVHGRERAIIEDIGGCMRVTTCLIHN